MPSSGATRADECSGSARARTHARFPERTNVQLVRVDGANDLTVGVWERGAGETMASGTSAVAAAAAAIANGWCESPVTVHLPGGDLCVELRRADEPRLTGPAVEIAESGSARCRARAARRSG